MVDSAAHHVTLESYEVDVHLERAVCVRNEGLDEVQEISEELVAAFQDTQSHERSRQLPTDVLSHPCRPIGQRERERERSKEV